MKRDKLLIRVLLEHIEACDYGHCFEPAPMAGHDIRSVKYHLHLLHQAGLVECEMEQAWDGEPLLIAHNLTLSGHDLLDNLREDQRAAASRTTRLVS